MLMLPLYFTHTVRVSRNHKPTKGLSIMICLIPVYVFKFSTIKFVNIFLFILFKQLSNAIK